MKIVTLNKSHNIINTVLHLEILYVLESEKLDGSPWGMSSHPNLHKCGKSLHPHLQGCFCGSLVDTYIHYLFYNSIFVHLSDLWMQFFLKIHFLLKVHFNSPYLINGLYAYIWECLNVNNVLVYLWKFDIGIHSKKKILLQPIYISSVSLREYIWQLYLLPPDSPKPRYCREERIDLDIWVFLFSVLL